MELAINLVSSKYTRVSGDKVLVREYVAEDVQIAISHSALSRKWVEIIGELLAPENRAAYTSFKYYDEVARVWRKEYQDIWRALNSDQLSLTQANAALYSSGIVDASLPMDASNTTKVFNTWVWGHYEQCAFGLVKVQDAMVTDTYVQNLPSVAEVLFPDGSVHIRNKFKLDSTPLALDESTLADLMNPAVARPVNHAVTVPSSLLVVK